MDNQQSLPPWLLQYLQQAQAQMPFQSMGQQGDSSGGMSPWMNAGGDPYAGQQLRHDDRYAPMQGMQGNGQAFDPNGQLGVQPQMDMLQALSQAHGQNADPDRYTPMQGIEGYGGQTSWQGSPPAGQDFSFATPHNDPTQGTGGQGGWSGGVNGNPDPHAWSWDQLVAAGLQDANSATDRRGDHDQAHNGDNGGNDPL